MSESPKPLLLSIHHASVLVADVARALTFYCDTLGLVVDPRRPTMPFPGAWLTVGGDQQIHLLQLPNPDSAENRPVHGGRDRHTAFFVNDLDQLQARLEAADIPLTRSTSGRAAIFCRDPDANGLELIQRGGDEAG